MWQNVWETKRFITTCSNSVLCTQEDISSNLLSYEKDLKQMSVLINQALKILDSLGGTKAASSRIAKVSKRIQRSAAKTVDQVPTVQSSCV